MPNLNITPRRIDFMRLLTRTGFAATRHLAESGLIANATEYSQSKFFKPLLDSQFIGRMMVISPYGIGKRVMYYLTRKGAEFLAELDGLDIESVRYVPLRGGIVKAADSGREENLIRADFPHKEAYVSTLLALERYLSNTDYQIDELHHYYDRKSGSTTIALDGKRFRPDGLVIAKPLSPTLPQYSFVIELHRHSDRRKILGQLKRHIDAYKSGVLAGFFGQGNPHFVLSVYADENAGVMQQTIDALRQDVEAWPYIERYFMFATLAEMRQDFYAAIHYFGSTKKPLPRTNLIGED